MPVTDADVIIVGAGPAGSMAAYHLATYGISVLVLEKSPFPRYKVCGGGLTHKIIASLPYDLSPVIETEIHSVRFSYNFSDVFTRENELPLMYCTMRGRLDQFMLEQAVTAGAKHTTGKVKAVKRAGDLFEVECEGKIYKSRMIMGADGASGIVAGSFGLKKNIAKGLAWEAEITADPALVEKYKSTVFLDWGTFPGGYGWVFPKKDHFSAGVGGPASLSPSMMAYYLKFMASTGLMEFPAGLADPVQIPGTFSLKSWPIPVRTSRGKFHSDGVMVLGDAAGLTDPLTGEGIYYAVRSGELAAMAAKEYLAGKAGALDKFSDQVNSEMMGELLEAQKISNIFNIFPARIHHFVRDQERAWRAFGKVLRGERWYKDVKSGFGIWKSAWNVISKIAGIVRKISL